MLNFTEDRKYTHQKGEKELTKVQMYYNDGTMQEITDVEPTMVLVGWEEFQKLRNERDQLIACITKFIPDNNDDLTREQKNQLVEELNHIKENLIIFQNEIADENDCTNLTLFLGEFRVLEVEILKTAIERKIIELMKGDI